MENELLKLQNGSDVRGVAVATPGGEPITLTLSAVNRIAQAFVARCEKKYNKPAAQLNIAVGMDTRISGKEIMSAFMDGLLCAGAHGIDCGIATTPAMYMSLVFEETAYDAAVMVTASHLPPNRNGMKFFDRDGGYDKPDITELLNAAAELEDGFPDETQARNYECYELVERYAEDLCDKIKNEVNAADYGHPLAGLHIVVDAGGGAAGFFASDVLEKLGADTSGSRYLEPDGMFKNHVPNPEDKQAFKSIVEATLESKADLGLIFDTDVDRMSAVLEDGSSVNRDELIAMMSAILAPKYPGSTIVTDSVTSDRLTDFLEGELGLRHLRFKRGYKNVINKSKELNDAGEISPLAIETSGHGAMKENYFLDDGAYQAVKLIAALAKTKSEGKSLNDLIAGMSREFADEERRIRIEEEDYRPVQDAALKAFEEGVGEFGGRVVDGFEGVRASFATDEATGWMLLRASLHDPVLVLNIEGRTEDDLKKLGQIADSIL